MESVEVHERYTTDYQYDVALLRVPDNLTLSDRLQPGCLPTAPHNDTEDAIVLGWGVTSICRLRFTLLLRIHWF